MTANIEEKINDIIKKMTLKAKIGQLNQDYTLADNADDLILKAKNGEIGSVILCSSAFAGSDSPAGTDIGVLNKIQRAAAESEYGIPVIFAKDVIHGDRVTFPIPIALSATFNAELIEKCYSDSAKEASNDGVQWTLAPMVDCAHDPRWGRIVESPGEDPYLGAIFAKAAVRGLQGDDMSAPGKIAACAKHFIGYGASEAGRDYIKSELSDYTLRNFHLPAFKAAVETGVATVMSSFNEVSGQPTTSSHYLLTEMLKKELGFDGFIISDWESVIQLMNQGAAESRERCAELAVNAGLDMDMADGAYIENLEGLVKDGRVLEETINESVRRILRIKFKLGLFENPYIERIKTDKAEMLNTARTAASEAIVLLKNNNSILPLKKDGKYGLVGPMCDDKRTMLGIWTALPDVDETVTISEGIKNVAPDAEIHAAESVLFDDMVMSVWGCDTVIAALGESAFITGEAASVTVPELSYGQKEILRTLHHQGKKIVGVLCCGRPMVLTDTEEYFDAILYVWHGGIQAGNAIADVLFGNTCPSGHLPVTFPRSVGQIPLYYNINPCGRKVNSYYYKDGDFHSYKDEDGSPLYPFGFGLSYTTFEYGSVFLDRSEISVCELENGEAITAKVTITNKGDLDGAAVPMCFIRSSFCSMCRPIRELKGFEKILILKGETKTVKFTLSKNELGYYNGGGKFTVEPCSTDVYIGSDCKAGNKNTFKITK